MTVRLMVVVALRLPEVPVTVRVDFPAAAEEDAAMVSALPPLVVAGLKAPVTPAGRPATCKAPTLVVNIRSGCLPTRHLHQAQPFYQVRHNSGTTVSHPL